MKINRDKLPPNWCSTTLDEVCEILSGYGFPENLQGRTRGEVPFYKVGDISEAWKRNSIRLITANNYVSQEDVAVLRATLFPRNTTVFAKIGAAIALNRRALLSVPALVDNNVMGLHPNASALDPSFLFYFACTLRLGDISQATTVPSIRKSEVEKIEIPLPPLREQCSIVAEIEKQFTRLDAAVGALKRVQANLKRYRAAVLKAAVEGRLVPTEAELARREGRPYEPASELLKRILAERRARWEAAQLAKFRASGNAPKGETWKQKYAGPARPESANLKSLPEGWTWAATAQIGEVQLGRQRSPKNRSKEYPTKYVRAANITENGIDLTDVLDMDFDPGERRRYRLRPGDVLLSEASGSPGQVGKPAIWRDELEECCFQNTVIRMRPIEVSSDYLLVVFQSYYWGGLFARIAGGVGINHLGADKFSGISVPVPPLPEQIRIVTEVERRLSIIDELNAEVDADLKRADRLRQAVLKRAFEGKLVPQDPTDEPASVLLDRIRSERENAVVSVRKRSSRREALHAH